MADVEAGTRQLLDTLRAVLAQVAEPTAVLRTILDQAVAQTAAERGLFVEVMSGGDLDYQVLHQFTREELAGSRGDFSRQILTRVRESGRGVLMLDAQGDAGASASVVKLRLTSVLCEPLVVDGRVAAIIHLEHRRPGHFTSAHQDLLRGLLDAVRPAYEAMRAGRDVLRERDRLRESASRYSAEAEESRDTLQRDWSFGRFIGRSAAVRELEAVVRKAAVTDFPVLLLGETGTGKSILARVIHGASRRAHQAFATVFCPSMEKSMVEAELFGHRKGAFTGALADRPGKVQVADGGTLFLDEIGELPMEIQPKLLRLLQEKTYERVGDAEERKADVRVIAATNRDLEDEVRAGRFRRDLFERLNYVPLRIPPLRERASDIPLILRHCLDQHDDGRWIELSGEGADYLARLDFAWPGNVRHLDQLAARLVMEAPRTPVGSALIARLLDVREEPRETAVASPAPAVAGAPREASQAIPSAMTQTGVFSVGLPALLEQSERAWLAEAVRRHPRLTRAELAAKLKISESALYKKLRAYGIGDEG